MKAKFGLLIEKEGNKKITSQGKRIYGQRKTSVIGHKLSEYKEVSEGGKIVFISFFQMLSRVENNGSMLVLFQWPVTLQEKNSFLFWF